MPGPQGRSAARGKRSKRADALLEEEPVVSVDRFADVAPQTLKVSSATSGNTRTVVLVAIAAAGYLLWRRFRPGQGSSLASKKGSGKQQAQQAGNGHKPGFRFDKLFTPSPNQPKSKPPAQDVQVTTSNIPRNKQHKKRKGEGRKGAGSGRHDGPDELPEYESTKFDRSKDAWVKNKTKFDNKGGRVVMQKETTTYSKGPQT